MIKKLLFIGLTIACITCTQAQNFKLNDQVINVGLGLGSYHYSGGGYKLGVPPLSVSFEKGIRDGVLDKGVLGVGGIIGFSSYTYNYGLNYSSRLSNLFVGGRGILHYPIIEDNKIDTYAGMMMGLQFVSYSDSNPLHSSGGADLAWSFFIGGRYYFSDQLGGMLELGYGMTYINLGLALKL